MGSGPGQPVSNASEVPLPRQLLSASIPSISQQTRCHFLTGPRGHPTLCSENQFRLGISPDSLGPIDHPPRNSKGLLWQSRISCGTVLGLGGVRIVLTVPAGAAGLAGCRQPNRQCLPRRLFTDYSQIGS